MTQPASGQVVPRDQLGDLERRAPGTTTADLSKVAVNLRQPLEDLDQAYRIAVMLAQSNLIPKPLQGSPQNTLIVIMTGMELGLTITQALRSVYVAKNGMPGLRGEMLLGKLRQAGHDYDYSEPVPEGCMFRLHRKHEAPLTGFAEEQCGQGRDYFGSFTQEDALRARLLTRDKEGKLVARSQYGEPLPHEAWAPDMMFWRAVTRAIRRGAPEITLGFSIAELDDGSEPPGPKIVNVGQVGEPPAPIGGDATYAQLQQIEREMTPAAGDDTSTGTGPAQGTTEPAAAPEASGPAHASAAAAGEAGGRDSRTQSDPRAAGAASPRGAQPPPPQANLMGQQDMFEEPGIVTLDDVMSANEPLIDPDCKAGKHPSCVGGPCECREGTHVTGHGLPAGTDPTPAPSAGTPKAATSRGSSSALLAESPWYDVADLFDQLGWPLKRHKTTVIDAISQHARHPVRRVEDLTEAEAEKITERLNSVRVRHEPEHWPVALADEVEAWREQWRNADPDGYAGAHPDGS